MNRMRLGTAVDAALLGSARRLRSGLTDAALVDEALDRVGRVADSRTREIYTALEVAVDCAS